MSLPIRVNADYEMELFSGKKSSPLINEALEYLALFLEDRPLFTKKKYSDEYLSYIKQLIGRNPLIVTEGTYENWWGKLKDLELEKKLNSKEFSASLSGAKVISCPEELELLSGISYLAKDPRGMSGQNIFTFRKGEELLLNKYFENRKNLIVEPLLKRVADFSHYIFPDNSAICYENLVDRKFQYKGTIFHNIKSPDINHLSFAQQLSVAKWNDFLMIKDKILKAYRAAGAVDGFSIDSFVYDDVDLQIYPISEVNYRKTMGLIAFNLLQKLAPEATWGAFVLGKNTSKKTFLEKLSLTQLLSKVIYLSPGDSRFDMFLISAENTAEGIENFHELKKLLSDTEFSIEI